MPKSIRVEYRDTADVPRRVRLRPEAAARLCAAGWAREKFNLQTQQYSRTEIVLRADLRLVRLADGSWFPVPRVLPPPQRPVFEQALRLRLDCERWARWALAFCPEPRDLYDPLLHAPFRAA